MSKKKAAARKMLRRVVKAAGVTADK